MADGQTTSSPTSFATDGLLNDNAAAPEFILFTGRTTRATNRLHHGALSAYPGALADLRAGLVHCCAAGWIEAPRVEDAVAEHCMGGAGLNEPFTRLTQGKLLSEGGTFLRNIPGHVEDGDYSFARHHGCAYRLRLAKGAA